MFRSGKHLGLFDVSKQGSADYGYIDIRIMTQNCNTL